MKQLSKKVAIASLLVLISSNGILATDYEGHWAEEPIKKWNGYGVVKGYENGDFRPSNPITRAELASILDRIFRFKGTNKPSIYIDIIAEPNKWYVESVNKVSELELMYINGMFFEPNALVTREEAVYAIAKAYELESLEKEYKPLSDESNISGWAKEAVKTLVSRGFIEGMPTGEFLPQSTITRAEIVTLLDNITGELINKPGTYTKLKEGNIIINNSEVVLKDLAIKGDLYITQAVERITLDNVVVTGTVYANGGNLELSGTYKQVNLCTGKDINITKGVVEKLVVNKAGSSLKVGEQATLKELVQNIPIQLEGEGSVGGTQVGVGEVPILKSAKIYINGQYIQLPLEGDTVTIDIADLSTRFNLEDCLDGFEFGASVDNCSITSSEGSINTDTLYSFDELEKELGIVREAALKAGVSPILATDKLFGSGTITIGGLLENYEQCKELAEEFGYTLENSYTFERYLSSSSAEGKTIYITLRLG